MAVGDEINLFADADALLERVERALNAREQIARAIRERCFANRFAREIEIKDGKFSDEMKGYAVRLFRCER